MSNAWMIKKYISHVFTAKRGGHGVHSPFVYKLVENVFANRHHFYVFDELSNMRTALCESETELRINDMGAGSQKLQGDLRKVKDIARYGVSSKQQAELLFKLVTYLNCKTIIELGTSIGLTTLYFSYANSSAQVFTLEGSEELVNFSREVFKKCERTNIISVPGNFDETFPKLLQDISSFDLLYIDGNHTYEATMRYFKLALEKTNPDSVIIFDDIYWSKDMTRAWEEIKANDAVKLSIDCFYFGMVFFRNEQKQKEHFKLYI